MNVLTKPVLQTWHNKKNKLYALKMVCLFYDFASWSYREEEKSHLPSGMLLCHFQLNVIKTCSWSFDKIVN